MTQDEIIRMAREAGIEQHRTMPDMTINLIHFAALLAEATKEKAAKVCEEQIKSYMSKRYTTDPLGGYRERFAAEQCAAAIRSMK